MDGLQHVRRPRRKTAAYGLLGLTYDNARLSQALLAAGRFLGERALIEHALSTLDWHVGQVGLAGPGPLVNIDNTWSAKADAGHDRARGDEQPLDAAALVEALVAAWQATGRSRYARLARRAFAWFHGANEGAESTLAYYQALLARDAAGLVKAWVSTSTEVDIGRRVQPAVAVMANSATG
jgi:uncharacterized protein YyaL (SSP411 family)